MHAIHQNLATCRCALKFRRLPQHCAEYFFRLHGAIPLQPRDEGRPDLDAGRQFNAAALRSSPQAKCHVQGALGVIFMAVGNTEERHDAIRAQVVHVGGVTLQGGRCTGQEVVELLLLLPALGDCGPAEYGDIQHNDLAHCVHCHWASLSLANNRHLGDDDLRRYGRFRFARWAFQQGTYAGMGLDAQFLRHQLGTVFVLAHRGGPVTGSQVQLDQAAVCVLFQWIQRQPAPGRLQGSLQLAGRALRP